MLYIVRYNPGNGGWALATIINSCLGHEISDSKAPQFEGNAHNTSLYDWLSPYKEGLRTGTSVDVDNVAIPIHYEFNVPEGSTVIDMYRSKNHYLSAWNLYKKEEDWELNDKFVANQVRRSMRKQKGNFDTVQAFDKLNVDYVKNFLSEYELTSTVETWKFYNSYVEKQMELNEICTITETFEKFTLR